MWVDSGKRQLSYWKLPDLDLERHIRRILIQPVPIHEAEEYVWKWRRKGEAASSLGSWSSAPSQSSRWQAKPAPQMPSGLLEPDHLQRQNCCFQTHHECGGFNTYYSQRAWLIMQTCPAAWFWQAEQVSSMPCIAEPLQLSLIPWHHHNRQDLTCTASYDFLSETFVCVLACSHWSVWHSRSLLGKKGRARALFVYQRIWINKDRPFLISMSGEIAPPRGDFI